MTDKNNLLVYGVPDGAWFPFDQIRKFYGKRNIYKMWLPKEDGLLIDNTIIFTTTKKPLPKTVETFNVSEWLHISKVMDSLEKQWEIDYKEGVNE